MLFDEAARNLAGVDFGSGVRRLPVAVVRPRSIDDIVRIAAYANKTGRKLAMRGQSHSLYGQAQVDGGIIIDSSTLNVLRPHGDDLLDAQPGALWNDVAKLALGRGRTPPVMVDALMLSVGGTLSVGGIGETSYREGCQVDHVSELDVVTAAGDHLTCSAERNDELFRMMLAGLGQCGIIVGARLHLRPAPRSVVLRTLTYSDLATLVSDQGRLATADGLGPLTSRIVKEPTGQVRFQLIGGSFFADGDDTDRSPPWMEGLQHISQAPPVRLSYWDYLDRRTASQTASIAAVKRGAKNPSLAFMLPAASVVPFVTHVLATPEAFAGIWLIEVFPMITARSAAENASGGCERRGAAASQDVRRHHARPASHARRKPDAGDAPPGRRRQSLSALCSRSVAGAVATALRTGDLATVCRRQEAVRSEQRAHAGSRNFPGCALVLSGRQAGRCPLI